MGRGSIPSPRCPPIRIRFVKESVDITNEQISYIKSAANKLEVTKVTMEEGNFSNHLKWSTLKSATLPLTSKIQSYQCGLTSKDFIDFSSIKIINENSLNFVNLFSTHDFTYLKLNCISSTSYFKKKLKLKNDENTN